MDILIFSIEDGRFGPARFPQMLHEAGLSVAALCPGDNILAQSCYLGGCHELPPSRNIRAIAKALALAISTEQPRIVIPGDEQAVILLQAFAQGRCATLIGPKARAIIAASLGDPSMFAASLFKSDTIALARSLGIAVPLSETVHTPAAAQRAAGNMGYPVYLKQSFSWAGQGVVRCEDAAVLRAAFKAARPRSAMLRHLARKALGRDWYPAVTAMDVQSGIAGTPAMFSVLAWKGRLIGGLCGVRLATVHASGPSTSVHLRHDQTMADAAGKLVAALGLTGFLSFDFMIPHDGGKPLLIECNPRPVPVHHLGRRIGVDMAEAFARFVRGGTLDGEPLFPDRDLDVVLFPHALNHALHIEGCLIDIPDEDPGLIRHVTGRTVTREIHSPTRLAA
ncbi:ATP-grasp domain-containing protein [Novosphingobium sp. MMS21-SN21R]|uniref:ATP-binding protein n=1 Tax=Novosphingobium sp. MMS21-SN21R TaxID=2969298 RepID=UPI0028878233|nr:ATP-grasp domain-containing protein [Novosphingobium sp. MMS21-SN21R]MDT0506953.1 ATP-grasp domain-containing protein [Novosphingobium sp. MMS21-SN21R]